MIKDRGGAGLTSPNSPTNPSGGDVAEGVSFDGVTDYLSRSTDLVGNVDSKTFTFSCWVYIADFQGTNSIIYSSYTAGDTNYSVEILLNNNGRLSIVCRDGATNSTKVSVNGVYINKYIWTNIIISADLTDTSNRHLYINDNDASADITWYVYENSNITFTNDSHKISAIANGTNQNIKGRLSNLFLAYEYVDLSIESNRRMFITADGKPA
jgi:hypothetical protein